ncbi:uncharacterized protein LOC116935144 isoform X2 [Daphnia magna]|uniref:uncharacterized protein LOC116935144 isoform X2 n=1 Tax=Daphnia magna TaxID=35525 RepID=UPI001E1BBDBF|nr:uncharacterized protein LOC116935144 isoform X2 [Daphnia magna]
MSVLFEKCLTCGASIDLSILEKHVTNWRNTRSRKSIQVNILQLKELLDHRVPVEEICQKLSVSRRTLFRVMKESNLSARPNYTHVSDDKLKVYMTGVLNKNPRFGLQMFKGYLVSQNVLLKQKRLRSCYQDVRISENAPMTYRIHRRVYHVRSPLTLWHIDGHHKFDKYGFIIHGAIDGYSRLIPYISLENNNNSETVVGLFEKSVEEWGYPASVRSDLGGENVLVADFMINARGVNRNSFRTGKSVHNQRVERLWKDAIERCTITFMEMFQEMQTDGLLDVDSEMDLLCLHMVAYDVIQRSLQAFKNAWNCHPIRTEHHKSPMELYISGLTQLKEDEEQGKFEGQVTELIQGKKLKPLTEWCGYADTFHRCVLDKFRVDLSLHDLVAGEITIDPKSVEITNLRQKYQQLKFFFMQRVNV